MSDKKIKHPAKFSQAVLDEATKLMRTRHVAGTRWLDPFAGTGLIHPWGEALGITTTGVEIEPEWAEMHPRTIQGDALHLPADWTNRFYGTFTSPCYGNRMADAHNAKERCKPCQGSGDIGGQACRACGGEGRRFYTRNTYTHTIGHKLHANNSGAMQYGKKYREFHEAAWAEMDRVTRSRFLLNISNHIRNSEEVDVTSFHVETVEALGWKEVKRVPVYTPRNGFGANSDKRVDHEWLILFRKR